MPSSIHVNFPLTGNSPAAQQFLNRLVTPPLTPREALYRTLIDALVSGGVWSTLDALFIFAATDQMTAVTNLVQSAHTAYATTAFPTFAANSGITPTYATKYLFLDLVPNSVLTHYSQDSACLFAWSMVAVTGNTALLNPTGSATTGIWPYMANAHALWGVNHSSARSDAGVVTDATGFWIANRSSATASTLRRNDALLQTSTNASQAPDSGVLAMSSNSGLKLAAAGYGSSLTSDQQSTLYSALQTYLTGVGAI